jgi:hypothetical protein
MKKQVIENRRKKSSENQGNSKYAQKKQAQARGRYSATSPMRVVGEVEVEFEYEVE